MRTITLLVLLALPAGCDRAGQVAPGRSPQARAEGDPAVEGGSLARGVPGSTRPRVLIQIGNPRYGLAAEQVADIAREVPEVDVVAALREELPGKVAEADALLGIALR